MTRGPLAAVVLALAAALLAGCAGTPRSAPTPSTPSADPAPTPAPTTPATPTPAGPTPAGPTSATPAGPAYSTWPLGTRVLPRRPDGYGVVRATPPSLRERRYPTRDRLPPPPDGRFHATVGPVTPGVRRRMGSTWSPRCPVGLDDLRHLRLTFRGFDGDPHTGELVVAADQARGVVGVFRRLYRADYPIEEMRLPSTTDLEAPPTGDGNDTAAYVCRPTTGATTTYSAHAYGLALDLNPFLNPYAKGDLVLPERARNYLDRSWRRPGMLDGDSVAVRAFARIGWSWGGDFQSLKDYQHFTATGR